MFLKFKKKIISGCCCILLLMLPFVSALAQNFNIKLLHLDYFTTDDKMVSLKIETDKPFVNDHIILSFDQKDGRYSINLRALNPIRLKSAVLEASYQPQKDTRYFCNGFQSWSTTREYNRDERIARLNPLLNAYSKNAGDYYLYKHSRKKGQLHSWSWTYWRADNKYKILTSLSEASGFTVFRYDIDNALIYIEKDCEDYLLLAEKGYELFDFVYSELSGYAAYSNVMQKYAQQYFQKYALPRKADAPSAIGWTSWYYHYADIDEKLIEDNLNAYTENELPIDIFQIDDGYQQAVGDWLITNKKFPSGMKTLADKIHAKGFKAGIWLAPFVAAKKSELFKKQPDWFIKKPNGKHLMVAKNVIWKGPYYALDIYHPEAREYIKKVIKTILRNWNYDLIKVDFLFAACLQPRHDRTRGQIMYDGMRLLHEAAGEDKLILGCGVPLASAFGLVDYCRIGNDAHTGWELKPLKKLHAHERPSTWSTLTNSVNRHVLNGRFFQNDPDVYLLRNKKCKLSERQKKTMFLLNNLFGEVLFTSDDIREYDSLQMQLYKSAFPVSKREITNINMDLKDAYIVEFNIENKKYCAYFNLSKKSVKLPVPQEHKFYFDAENNNFLELNNQREIKLLPFESKLFLLMDQKI